MTTTETAPTLAFSHSGKLGQMLALALKNAFLSIITLTLYRFWARTSIRRRIWSRTWALGDSFEYTGSGWDLFRGFLISLPCFFLPAIFVFYIAPYVMEPGLAVWLTLGFYIVAVPVVAAARFWMRRYQLSRTRWRGIRFGLSGSGWSFASASWGWSMLQGLTLGWYSPVARMKRARLLWENARFGDQPFEFANDPEGDARGLWWPFALSWFAPYIAIVGSYVIVVMAAIIVGVAALSQFGEQMQNLPPGADPPPELMAAIVGGFVLWGLIGLTLWLLLQAPYKAAAMNKIASMISLDGAQFRLRATTGSLFGVDLLGWLIIIFSLGLLAPLAGLLQIRYVFNRLELVGVPKFAEIGQSVIDEQKAGESFADAFDLDLGVGMI
jgi:uncharacterized membrane protein YjgN (DUF898 family)